LVKPLKVVKTGKFYPMENQNFQEQKTNMHLHTGSEEAYSSSSYYYYYYYYYLVVS